MAVKVMEVSGVEGDDLLAWFIIEGFSSGVMPSGLVPSSVKLTVGCGWRSGIAVAQRS